MDLENSKLEKLVVKAQQGDGVAMSTLISMFYPLIRKNSYINGELNEDCVQELTIRLIIAIRRFKFIKKNTSQSF
ncbi:hypothetical protein Curi_c00390 [Gottschalkia acidurici 9a]|uniref:Helix-turn-helix conjugative transposon-like domain-containing protein n=1 Tax=Gottschalkia acidurici (strain ATCC 7906 / DSM 604 / BCRC 14475 / CIP 104303 / KCTC 5404 / NCIMB 10678 / 9a) TaxID=1128398 RepID=K0AXE6_GOTA9|nr:helix-turn-helix domain-containing protein [Gottschalkia acidurici]AFS77121.1 hypothetical protein Curi_c00390 [Gottschalkia acidurici 9a]